MNTDTFRLCRTRQHGGLRADPAAHFAHLAKNLTSCQGRDHRFNFSQRMTTRTEAEQEKSFVSARLPWILAVLAAVLYVLTLNHWLSLNLQPFARATGQSWVPETFLPVFNLVTSPFRWLPETSVPLAFNLFSAVCATLVLLLLARSVALLPHDRTHLQREREQSRF